MHSSRPIARSSGSSCNHLQLSYPSGPRPPISQIWHEAKSQRLPYLDILHLYTCPTIPTKSKTSHYHHQNFTMADGHEEDRIRKVRDDLMFGSRYENLLRNASGEDDDTLRERQSSHSQGMCYYHFRQSLERVC